MKKCINFPQTMTNFIVYDISYHPDGPAIKCFVCLTLKPKHMVFFVQKSNSIF